MNVLLGLRFALGLYPWFVGFGLGAIIALLALLWGLRTDPVAGRGPGDGVSITPDVESSTDSYAARFAGSLGDWFLERQAAGVLQLLSALDCRSVLEIGAGHGQLTGDLRSAGYEVFMQGSAFDSAARVRRLYQHRPVPFVVALADQLPLSDRAVDAVVAIRFMAHFADPAGFLRECCRVADKMVVVEFPSQRSFNAFIPLMFSFKRALEGDTRRFRIFDPLEPGRLALSYDFRQAGMSPLFFFPMAAHRLHGSRTLAAWLESASGRLGLTHRLGSPIIASFHRSGAS
jgi:SAM-dependent methyltransferase